MSAKAPAIAELAGEPQLILCPGDASNFQVVEGDGIAITAAGGTADTSAVTLEVVVDSSMVKGCIGYTVGMWGTESLVAGSVVTLEKAIGWQRQQPQIIATDNPNAPNPRSQHVQIGASHV